MRKLGRIIAVVAVSVMATASITAYAIEKQPQIKNEVVIKTGKMFNLFHSGTADVKKRSA